jgi:hypothetical protein
VSRRLAQGRRHQKAVLWAYHSNGNQGETRVVSTAVELDVRWEEKQTERLDPQNKPIATDYDVVVDRDVAIGSILWFGELDDWTLASATDYRQVVTSEKVTDLRGRNPRRVLGLIRYTDELPERV